MRIKRENFRGFASNALLAFIVMAVMSGFAIAGRATQDEMGKLTVVGKVTIDGQPAATGDVFHSGSVGTTAKGSSAVVSLGKLGRVEIMPSSTMKLTFSNSGMTAMLDAGRVRVSSSSGTSATVTTKDGEIVADSTQANMFTVNTECGNTIVSTQTGKVELRSHGVVTRIPAGSTASVGNGKPGCP